MISMFCHVYNVFMLTITYERITCWNINVTLTVIPSISEGVLPTCFAYFVKNSKQLYNNTVGKQMVMMMYMRHSIIVLYSLNLTQQQLRLFY